MSVEFYIVEAVGLEATLIQGTLDDLSKYVSEDAAVDWDRFCSDNGIEAEEQIRFVCVGGTWRAFTGKPNAQFVERDGFLAQWWSCFRIPEADIGHWSRTRTEPRSQTKRHEHAHGRAYQQAVEALRFSGAPVDWPPFMGGEK